MLLARRGYRVLLVDRSSFPSDLHQGHFIHKQGPRLLAEWGLLERVAATDCPPATTHATDFGDFLLVGRDVVKDGVAWGYGPRRLKTGPGVDRGGQRSRRGVQAGLRR
jgi:2-polyprenyl-6-methoxyphenol hydroxylase-like FAD-dependent oxidoreductase